MKKKISIALIVAAVIVSAVFAWRVAYSMRKSNDNLPALTMVSEMSEADVNSLLMGYRIIQLREVWGAPDYSKDNEDIWQIGDVTLTVNYKNNGKVAVCGLKAESNATYKVEIVNNYPIENTLASAYKAGEQVTIQLSTVTEHYYIVSVNGIELEFDAEASDMTYTYYTFTMPSEDVVIVIEDVSMDIPGAKTFVVEIWDRVKEEQLDCADAIEKFYEDDTTEYYFSCIKSHYIMVMDNTGRTIDIVTALNEGLATIADLDYYGIEYHTKTKN